MQSCPPPAAAAAAAAHSPWHTVAPTTYTGDMVQIGLLLFLEAGFLCSALAGLALLTGHLLLPQECWD